MPGTTVLNTQCRPGKVSRMDAYFTRTKAYSHHYMFQISCIVHYINWLFFMKNLPWSVKLLLIYLCLRTLFLQFVTYMFGMNQKGRQADDEITQIKSRRDLAASSVSPDNMLILHKLRCLQNTQELDALKNLPSHSVGKSHQLENEGRHGWQFLREAIMKNAAHPYRLVICVPLECPVWPLYTTVKSDSIWNLLDAKMLSWTKCNRVLSANTIQGQIQSYFTQPTTSVSMHKNELFEMQTDNCNSVQNRQNITTKMTVKETEEIHIETKQPPSVDAIEPIQLEKRPKGLDRRSVCQAIDKAILKCGASSHHSGSITVGHDDKPGSELVAEMENASRDYERTDVEHPMPEVLASSDINEKEIKTTEGKDIMLGQDDQGIPEIRKFTQIPLREMAVPKASVVNMLHQTSVLSTADSGSTRHSLETVEIQATPQPLQSVVETDGNSGAPQNSPLIITQATTQTLESVIVTDGNSGTAQNDTSLVTQATTQTLQSVVETDGNSGTAQNNTSIVTQATTHVLEETDGNPEEAEISPTIRTNTIAQTQQATNLDTQGHEESELDKVLRRIARGEQVGPRITMRFELLRLCTLRNYPKENKPYITRLSAAGFYFAAEADELICYCCGIRKRGWNADSNPMAIHRRLSPNCSFLTNNARVNVGVPRGDGDDESRDRFANLRELLEETPGAEIGSDATLAARVPSSDTTLIARGPGSDSVPQYSATGSRIVANQNPRHPHYGVYSVRLNSFVNWPTDSGQSPATLAEAGFYFAGIGDCVRCFHCGVGLRHWAAEDDPWIEHGRWSLQNPCHYLLQMKGEEFLSLITMALEITDNQPPAVDAITTEDSVRVNAATQQSQSNQPTTQPSDHTSTHGTRDPTTAQQSSHNQPSTQTTAGTSTHGKIPVPGGSSSSLPTVGKGSNSGQAGRGHLGKKGNSLDIQKQLQEENRRLRQQTVCRVCDQQECIVFLPCGHLVACAECAPSVRTCMVCKKVVKGTVKTFMS